MKLTRALGLRDIVLLNVTAIIGLRWISLAASSGNVSILLWLGALLLFFIPQAFAVIELTTRLPEEGGIYSWAKTAFGDFHGFLSGWCYWTNNLIYFPNLLVYIAGIAVFILGPSYQSVGETKVYILAFSLVALWGVTLFNILGLKIGRWVNNIGGAGTWAAGGILILFGMIAVIKYGLANPMPPGSFTEHLFSFEKLAFWASICFAFSGLELASVMAGEIRNPEKSIPRAVVISGIVIAVIYILGTLAMLVALPADEINIITGFLQGIAAIGNKLGLGWTANLIALLITLGGIGGLMAWFTGAARMPFVSGVDRYLPAGFGKLHPRYGSPYIAIIFQSVVATAFILMSFIGATVQEAYLILLDTTLLVYFIPYLYMFAAYLVLRRKQVGSGRVLLLPRGNRKAYFSGALGLATTLIAMLLALVPAAEIRNVFLYELKVVGGFLIFIGVGVVIYRLEARKRKNKELAV
ncbi:MAG: APC family permease [Fidelibacterota bacterium]